MGISQADFDRIVQEVAQESSGCDAVEVHGNIIDMHWRSRSGIEYITKFVIDIDGNTFDEIVSNSGVKSMPPPGSTAPGIFYNRLMGAIKNQLR